jgi:radical SAM superfamily enzyme YgiQ (UPF0313 family)
MKVLLIAPPKRGLAGSEVHPPVGLGYLATALRKIGHEPEIKDCILEQWDNCRLLDHIRSSPPDVVGVTVFSQAVPYVRELLDSIKKEFPRVITVIGGPHPTAIPEDSLRHLPSADWGIQGEGEIPLSGMMHLLQSGKGSAEEIPGLIWRENGRIRFNPKVEHEPVDDFGFPAWDLVDPPRYFSARGIGQSSGVIHTGRGCPFECQFCVRLGKKLRHRGLDAIYEEMRLLHDRYGVDRFYVNDEGFGIAREFVKSFCRYVIGKGDNFRYVAATGLRLSILDEEMLSLMRKAGFEPYVGIGIESGVPRVRELMRKRLTQEEMIRGVALLKKHGFRPVGNFIFGFPGETKAEMEATLRVALRLKLWGAGFAPFIPLPGSEATKMLIEKGELPADFDFSRIDLDAVLYAPPGTTREEIDRMRRKAVFRFNTQPRMLWYHVRGGRLFWAIVKFSRIFLPDWIVPRAWRRLS